MNLETTTLGDTLVVQVTADRIDAACAIQFKDRMREIASNAPHGHHGPQAGALCRQFRSWRHRRGDEIPGPFAAAPELAALTANVAKVFHLTHGCGLHDPRHHSAPHPGRIMAAEARVQPGSGRTRDEPAAGPARFVARVEARPWPCECCYMPF